MSTFLLYYNQKRKGDKKMKLLKKDMINWLINNKRDVAEELTWPPKWIKRKDEQATVEYMKEQMMYHVLKEKIEKVYISLQ